MGRVEFDPIHASVCVCSLDLGELSLRTRTRVNIAWSTYNIMRTRVPHYLDDLSLSLSRAISHSRAHTFCEFRKCYLLKEFFHVGMMSVRITVDCRRPVA